MSESKTIDTDLRFFHNATGARHIVVKMTHTLYCYIVPVAFAYVAMNFGAKESDEANSLSTSQVFNACIFFFLSASCQVSSFIRRVAMTQRFEILIVSIAVPLNFRFARRRSRNTAA